MSKHLQPEEVQDRLPFPSIKRIGRPVTIHAVDRTGSTPSKKKARARKKRKVTGR
jgi:hypothetical protein